MSVIERLRLALTFRPIIRIGRELSRLNDNFESYLYHSQMPSGAQHKLLLAEAAEAEKQSIATIAGDILGLRHAEDRQPSELELAIADARAASKRGQSVDPDILAAIAQEMHDLDTYKDDNPLQEY